MLREDPPKVPEASMGQRREVPMDTGEFRTVLGHFASGVVVVTGTDAAEPVGFTCQSFFSLSLEPPLVAIGAGLGSTTWPRIAGSGRFCVNVLESEQESLARSFANSGGDKFAGVGWSPGPTGTPHLHGALAYIDCTIRDIHEAGDHVLVVGLVEDLEARPGHPLLFYRGGFGGFDS